jgi:hypothetical protein
MASISNSPYQPGDFYTLCTIKKIDSWSDGLNPVPTYSASETAWVKKEAISDKDSLVIDKEGIASQFKLITRRYMSGIQPNKHIVTLDGVDYDVVKVDKIERRVHTIIFCKIVGNGI